MIVTSLQLMDDENMQSYNNTIADEKIRWYNNTWFQHQTLWTQHCRAFNTTVYCWARYLSKPSVLMRFDIFSDWMRRGGSVAMAITNHGGVAMVRTRMMFM
jgi:hypothetical protein